MVNIELLKRLTFLADITKKFEPFLFDDIEIRINTLLEKSDDVSYAFQVLKVPFTTFEPDTGANPDEINISFGSEVGLNVIYLITYILKEIYGDTLDVYINYATEPAGRESKTVIGSYITRDKDFTNISAPIATTDILKLDISNMDWEEFSNLFPNNNYSDNRTCTYTENQYERDYDNFDYDDYDDYHRSYDQYELEMADWDYDPMNPAHDPSENPWIDVFGPGDEAETAYWNTD